MSDKRTLSMARLAVMAVGASLPGWQARAQIVPSTTPITMPSTESLLGPMAANAPKPATDPRDLNGVYQPEVNTGGRELDGEIRGTPRPAPGAGEPADGRPASPTATQACEPGAQIGFGGDVNQIIQFPDRIYFIAETNHVVRRVYLDREFPETITPTYAGTSRGHWEGDTLVVETRGLKGSKQIARGPGAPPVKSITRLLERVHKVDGGKRLQIDAVVEGVAADGQPMRVTRTEYNRWRSDLRLMESSCEDGAVLFYKSDGT